MEKLARSYHIRNICFAVRIRLPTAHASIYFWSSYFFRQNIPTVLSSVGVGVLLTLYQIYF